MEPSSNTSSQTESDDFQENNSSDSDSNIEQDTVESQGPTSSTEMAIKDEPPEYDDNYSLNNLPLEVITTVEATTYTSPVLRNMTNGVLTHRNIFTEAERAVLKDIIDKYRGIVDTRSRTREIYLEKQCIWQRIVDEYNGTGDIVRRTEKELRKCWDNMKYRAKLAEKETSGRLDDAQEDLSADMQALSAAAEQVRALQLSAGQFDADSAHQLLLQLGQEHELSAFKMENGTESEDAGNHSCTSEQEVYRSDADDDPEPLLKRARQESPKLSSLLLGASWGKKDSINCSTSNLLYNIPSCTRVVQIKKKKAEPAAGKSKAKISSSPVPILPKSLSSYVSITNIPAPKPALQIYTRGGRSVTNLSQLNGETSSPVKPMPSLKKMVPGGSKKRSKRRLSSEKQDDRVSTRNVSDRDISQEEKEHEGNLSATLLVQRLEQEKQEHELRLRVYSKELQAFTYQSQYWALKLKRLRNGSEDMTLGHSGARNGDIN